MAMTKAGGWMTELSADALAHLQTAAAAGLVVCLLMAGAFATLGFVTTGEQDRRQAALDSDRLARISALLAENETSRAARRAVPTPLPPAREALAALDPVPAPAEVDADAPVIEIVAKPPTTGPADLFAAAGPLPEVPPEARDLLLGPARRLAAGEATALADALRGQAGAFSIEVVTAPETEARLYAVQLTGALRGAGLDARGPVAVLTTAQTHGLLVSVEDDANGPGAEVLSALQAAGIDALPTPSGGALGDILIPDGTDVRVYVGGLRRAPTAQPQRERARARMLEDA